MPKTQAISFEEAKAQYVHRYTMEHVPTWAASRPCDSGGTVSKYYAPQYRTDKEWYDNTLFGGDNPTGAKGSCYSTNPSWPLGHWLDSPML